MTVLENQIRLFYFCHMQIILMSAVLLFSIVSAAVEFNTPPSNYSLRTNHSKIDPRHLIRPEPLQRALKFYEFNYRKLTNSRYLTLVDFSMHASKQRMFLIDMQSGGVTSMLTSVGRGSDPDGNGYADSFSNEADSNQSSLGFYLTQDIYDGDHGRSLRLDGLSPTNSNALERAIVVHTANYVSEEDHHAGRSHGCPVVDPDNINPLIDRIQGGSLMFLFFR